jgi:hypothetical protein
MKYTWYKLTDRFGSESFFVVKPEGNILSNMIIIVRMFLEIVESF